MASPLKYRIQKRDLVQKWLAVNRVCRQPFLHPTTNQPLCNHSILGLGFRVLGLGYRDNEMKNGNYYNIFGVISG